MRLADSAAIRHGFDLRHYRRTTVRFYRDDELLPAQWVVVYTKQPLEIGEHFFVHVDDRTKKIAFGYGR
jgi:hypothetical protein